MAVFLTQLHVVVSIRAWRVWCSPLVILETTAAEGLASTRLLFQKTMVSKHMCKHTIAHTQIPMNLSYIQGGVQYNGKTCYSMKYTMSKLGIQGQNVLNHISFMLNLCPCQLRTATFVQHLVYCLVSIFSVSCWRSSTSLRAISLVQIPIKTCSG